MEMCRKNGGVSSQGCSNKYFPNDYLTLNNFKNMIRLHKSVNAGRHRIHSRTGPEAVAAMRAIDGRITVLLVIR